MTKVNAHKSVFDLDANIVSFICYIIIILGGFIDGLRYVVFLIPLTVYFLEKKSKYVRDNAMQAFTISFLAALIYIVFNIIAKASYPVCSWDSGWSYSCTGSWDVYRLFSNYFTFIISFVVLVISITSTIRTYNYELTIIPGISDIAFKFSEFLDKTFGTKMSAPVSKSNNKEEETKEEKLVKDTTVNKPTKAKSTKKSENKKMVVKNDAKKSATKKVKKVEEKKTTVKKSTKVAPKKPSTKKPSAKKATKVIEKKVKKIDK